MMRALILAFVGCLPLQSSATPTPSERTPETARYDDLPAYPSEPADPWAGVANGEPARWSEEQARYWKVRANDFACTAAHDHCLPKEGWFLENDDHRARNAGRRRVSLHVFGPHGPIFPVNAENPFRGNPYTAYRTVPATKKNLIPGAIAVVFPRPDPHPRHGQHAIEQLWEIGTVETVDVELGVVKLVGADDTHLLSGARVVVMQWKPGEKVRVVGATERVVLSDVFLPR